jgi:hypothetical protein
MSRRGFSTRLTQHINDAWVAEKIEDHLIGDFDHGLTARLVHEGVQEAHANDVQGFPSGEALTIVGV